MPNPSPANPQSWLFISEELGSALTKTLSTDDIREIFSVDSTERQGQLKAAIIVLKATLSSREKGLGPDHVDTVGVQQALISAETELVSAVQEEQQSRAELEAKPKRLDSLYNLGGVLAKQGKYADAEGFLLKLCPALHERAQPASDEMRSAFLQQEIGSLRNLTLVAAAQGKADEALRFKTECLELLEKLKELSEQDYEFHLGYMQNNDKMLEGWAPKRGEVVA